MSTALRAWLRYLVPLTVLSAIACAPVVVLALRAKPAADLDALRMQVRIAWIAAGTAWFELLLVVAAVAPAVRGALARAPLSQLGVLRAGLGSLAHAILPCVAAAAAIAIGGAALVVPGVVLLVLLAPTGAAPAGPLPAPLTAAVAGARPRWRTIAAALAVFAVVLGALGVVLQLRFFHGLPVKPPARLLGGGRTFVRLIALAIIGLAPPIACVIAATAPAPSDAEPR